MKVWSITLALLVIGSVAAAWVIVSRLGNHPAAENGPRAEAGPGEHPDPGVGSGTALKVELPPDSPLANRNPRGTLIEDLDAEPSTKGANLLAAGRFGPSGTVFPGGIQATWPLASPRPAGERLWIVTFDPEQKKWLGNGEMATVAASGREASGRVYHFSDVGVTDAKPEGFEGDGSKSYRTDHFTVRYDLIPDSAFLATGDDVASPRYVKDIAQELEFIRGYYDRWGFKTPEHQVVRVYPIVHGWDYVFDPSRTSLRPEVAGEAAKLGGQLNIGCFLPNDNLVPVKQLRITLAHEYFHRVQMQYYALIGPAAYVREGTAQLMELLVYPDAAEDVARNEPNLTPKFSSVSLTDQSYQSAAFFLYLNDRFKGPSAVREIFEEYEGLSLSATNALERVIKNHDASGSLSNAFFDFVEEFYATDPPSNKLYPLLRVKRGDAIPKEQQGKSIVERKTLGTAKKETLPFADMPSLTARYLVLDPTKPGKVKVRLESAGPGTSVRLYTVAPGKTTQIGMLHAPQDENDEGQTILLDPGASLGVLVANTGRNDGGAVVSVTRVLEVWVLKDGFPKTNPENKPLQRTLMDYKSEFGSKKETNEQFLTDAGHIAYRTDFVDTFGSTREYHHRWDFTIKFKGTVTGLAPRVLEPGERYEVEAAGKWTENTKKPNDLNLSAACWLGVHLTGLEFPHADRSLSYPEDKLWRDGLLYFTNMSQVDKEQLHLSNIPQLGKTDLQSTCGFRLADAPPDVVVLDFNLGTGGNAPAERYVYERKELTPKQLKEMIEKDRP